MIFAFGGGARSPGASCGKGIFVGQSPASSISSCCSCGGLPVRVGYFQRRENGRRFWESRRATPESPCQNPDHDEWRQVNGHGKHFQTVLSDHLVHPVQERHHKGCSIRSHATSPRLIAPLGASSLRPAAKRSRCRSYSPNEGSSTFA